MTEISKQDAIDLCFKTRDEALEIIIRYQESRDAFINSMPTLTRHPGGDLVRIIAHYADGSMQTIDGKTVTSAIEKMKGGSA